MTSDDRLSRLEDGLTEALVQNARLTSSIEHLSESVIELKATVKDLNDNMNKGKGALWAFMMASGAVGAMIPWGISKLFGPTS